MTAAIDRQNRALFVKLGVVACAMFGFGFALVPIYNAICEATGVNSLVRRDEAVNTQVDASRLVTIEFDSNVRGLPWSFTPKDRSVQVHPGQLAQVTYVIRNESTRAIAGQAIPSYGPKDAAEHFRKLECFCFTKQVLQPGESREMPVVFVVDSKLPKEIPVVTLSYTFFEVNGAVSEPRPATVAPGHAG